MSERSSKGKGVEEDSEEFATLFATGLHEFDTDFEQARTQSTKNSTSSHWGIEDEQDQESDEAVSLKTGPQTSAFALYHECLLNLNDLLSIIHSSPFDLRVEVEFQELCSRLQIWAGNHGAHRHDEDRMSLDYRLREAPDLHQEVRDHFNELISTLVGAIAIASTSEANIEFRSDENSSSSSDSDGSLTTSQKALIGLSIKPDPPSLISKLRAKSQSIDNIITSLYKFSITIQNPAHKDRTARATNINMSFWHEHDLRHVQDKFPKCFDSKLLQNLAQANTKRRQLFAYHKRHKDKIQYYQDSNVQKIPSEQPVHFENAEASLLQVLHFPVASTLRSSKTKLTMTTVSTVNPPIRTMAPSISGRSQRTNITVDPLLGSDEVLQIPPPPGHSKDFSEPFICPYCFLTIDPTSKKTWEHHVLDDLRPYACTFADCVSAPLLYERFSEWSTHEIEVHRREWFCNLCKTLCDTREEFTAHLQLRHQDLVADKNQIDPVISLCERMSTRDEDCPLCECFTGKPREVQTHLAQHLRQLALYTLPKLADDNSQESEAGTEIVNVRNNDAALSDNTQNELLKMSMDEYKQQYSIITPLDSPPRSLPDLDIPIDWEHFQISSLSLVSEHDEKEYQKLVKSFSSPIVTSEETLQGQIIQLFEKICAVNEGFSLLLSTADTYKKGFRPLVKWKRFRTDFIGFLDALQMEEMLFNMQLDLLIAMAPERLRTNIFRGIGYLSTEEIHGFQTIKYYLGSSLSDVEHTVSTIMDSLKELMKLLLIDRDGKISWADAGPKKWDYQMKRVELGFSKGSKLLNLLERANRSLRELLSAIEVRAPGKVQPLQQPAGVLQLLPNFAWTKRHVAALFTMLQDSWNCSCQANHTFMLGLEITKIAASFGTDWSSPFRLYITFSHKDGVSNLYNLEIVHHITKAANLIEIQSVCFILSHSRPETLLGYIGNDVDGYYILRLASKRVIMRKSDYYTPVGLSERLLPSSGEHLRLSRQQRYNMGSIFLTSLLQFSTTPFLEDDLRKERIFLLPENNRSGIDHPYLDFTPVFEKHLAQRKLETVKVSTVETVAVRSLRNLAILLLELLFGETIESQELREKYLGPDGKPREYTDYMTARDWAAYADEEDPALASVIKCCLSCTFGERADWKNRKFVRAVYTSAVQPWEKQAEKLAGKTVHPIRSQVEENSELPEYL